MPETFVAIWPVDDPFATLPTLMPPAAIELAAMAVESHVELLGPPSWRLDLGRLVATAPARQMHGRPARPVPWDAWLDAA